MAAAAVALPWASLGPDRLDQEIIDLQLLACMI
jgi:hypothetical protein